MAKEKKTARTVTEAIIEPSKPPTPATKEDEQVAAEIAEAKPLSQKERLDKIEQQLAQLDAQTDKNFQAIGDAFQKMQPLITLSEQIAARQAQPQPQGQAAAMPGDMGSFMQMVQAVLAGGGGTDSEMMNLGKEALKSQIGMSKAITDAVVAKITGKAVAEVAEKIVAAA